MSYKDHGTRARKLSSKNVELIECLKSALAQLEEDSQQIQGQIFYNNRSIQTEIRKTLFTIINKDK